MSNYPISHAPPESEELPVQQKKIRCRQCGQRAYENLVVCPHCGRELHAAAPRWLSWGVPLLIAGFFLLMLTGVGGGNPVEGVRTALEQGWAAIMAFSDKIEPRITVGGGSRMNVEPPANQPQAADAVAMIPAPEEGQSESVAVINVPVENASQPNTPAEPSADTVENVEQPSASVPSADAPSADAPSADVQSDAASQASSSQNGAAGEPAVAVDTPTFTPEPTVTETPIPPAATDTSITQPTATLQSTPTTAATATTQQVSNAERSGSNSSSLTVSNIRATSVALTKTVVAASSPTTTPTPLSTNTLAPTPLNLATNTPTQTPLPTSTATATATASATASATSSPTLAPTATLEPATYTIQPGDTLSGIATRYDTTVTILMDINGMSDEDVRRLRVGQVIALPSTVPPSANEVASVPTPVTYVIKSGDLPATIARQFGISVEQLLAANNLSSQDVTRLRIGQVLAIPSAGQSNSAASPSSTGPSSTGPNSAAQSSNNYRLDAPLLRSPGDGTPMSCSARDILVWNAVPFIGPTDQYVLHLGFVSNVGQNGEQTVAWILELIREQNRTSWDLDTDYCALAPQEWGRQWRWYVQVIDENGNPVSPPSDIWSFSWN